MRVNAMADHFFAQDLANRTMLTERGSQGSVFGLEDGQFAPDHLDGFIYPFLNLCHICDKGWAPLAAPGKLADLGGVGQGIV